LYCEIGRILCIFSTVTHAGDGRRALTPPLWGFEEREKLMCSTSAPPVPDACGLFPYRRVHQDLPAKADRHYEPGAIRSYWAVVADLERLLTGNRIFKQRNVDIGVVTLKQAWDGVFPA